MPGAYFWHGPSPSKSELIGISYVPIGAVCSENNHYKVKRFTFIVMGDDCAIHADELPLPEFMK